MSVIINVEQMTTVDKIRAMECFWDDLCRHAEESLSPPWHGDILSERDNSITVGEAQFIDWEQAKKKIRESLL